MDAQSSPSSRLPADLGQLHSVPLKVLAQSIEFLRLSSQLLVTCRKTIGVAILAVIASVIWQALTGCHGDTVTLDRMVDNCCAPGCRNRRGKKKGCSFYRIPKDAARREMWLSAIKRARSQQNNSERWDPPAVGFRLCSEHFIRWVTNTVQCYKKFLVSLILPKYLNHTIQLL